MSWLELLLSPQLVEMGRRIGLMNDALEPRGEVVDVKVVVAVMSPLGQ